MTKKQPHNVEIQNDFGTVVWDEEHEQALKLLEHAAWTLQMTIGEFTDMLIASDRECPKCKAGLH